jgi:hypothetical protein
MMMQTTQASVATAGDSKVGMVVMMGGVGRGSLEAPMRFGRRADWR